MTNTIYKILLIFLFTTSWRLTSAQVYPVQVTTQLTPPYSLYLSDYVAPGSERLAVTIFLGDIARPDLPVKLRLRISNIEQNIIIETSPTYNPPPLSIQGGVPLRLISTDIAEYFNPNNLNFQGITKRQYQQQGKLPEGVYQFCFEIVEYNRGIKISNSGCATAWMILNDPPIINLPRQNVKLKALSPQNVVFQWTPRHTGSPNSAFTTEYEIKMVEIWPATRNANDAILTSPVIFDATTQNTTLIYGPAETPLELGRKYAFRVQAKGKSGIDELDLFKNQGYSEVFSFTYGDACDLPTGISAEAASNRIKLIWESKFNHTSFNVLYRQVGTTQWYTNNSTTTDASISSLRPSTVYEYKIAATCGWFESDYTTVATVKTKEAPEVNYACGLPMETFNLDPARLTGSLNVGDVINAGDFDVELTKVSGSGGTFSGEGVVVMPMMNKVKVKAEFTNITVAGVPTATDYRMVKGFMNVTGAGVEVIPAGVLAVMDNLTELLDKADKVLDTLATFIPKKGPDPVSFAADTLVKVEGNILAVVKNPANGKITITSTSGKIKELEPGKSYAITDKDGKGYLVDSNGGITKTTAENAVKASKRTYNLQLNFAKANNTIYGFDEKNNDVLAYTYEKLGKDYYVPWKAVDASKPDYAMATSKDKSLDASKINFVKEIVEASVNPSSTAVWNVNLNSITPGGVGTITAFYPAPDTTKKEQVLGKLNIIGYNKESYNLVVVPVNNSINPFATEAELSALLKKIYDPAVVEWNVRFENKLTVTVGTPFDAGASDMLSNYTGDMKKVINAYNKHDDKTYYLFLIEKTSNITYDGYMPRSKQAGFLFVTPNTSKENFAHTAAHELGHGAFALKHTFSEFTTLPKGSTKNLMDYADATANELLKFQWDRIHDPVTVIGLFEEDEGSKYETDGHYSTVYLTTLMLGMDNGLAKQLAEATEAPDTDIHGEMDFELDQTWAYPLVQQDVHSLTGGFHGVEEMMTAFKFLWTPKEDIVKLGELLHRYGDTYAHTRLDNLFPDILMNYEFANDKKKLDAYINVWKNEKGPLIKDRIAPWIGFLNYYINLNGYGFLTNEYLQKKALEGKTIPQYLHDIYLDQPEDRFSMYGNSFFTRDHNKSDKGIPDYIYVRPNWYLTYVKNLAILLAYKYQLKNIHFDMTVFNSMVEFAIKNKCKLKGLIDYEISKKLNKKEVIIPVFYSSFRLIASADAVFNTNYLEEAKDALKFTKQYMKEKGITIINEGNEEVKGEYKTNSTETYDTQAYIIKFK